MVKIPRAVQVPAMWGNFSRFCIMSLMVAENIPLYPAEMSHLPAPASALGILTGEASTQRNIL